MKKLKFPKIKNLKNISQKNLLIALISATAILALTMLGLIYFLDKPTVVPEDVRGAVRDGIKNNVAKPLAAVIPAVGNPFFNNAFTYKNNSAFENSKNFISPDPNDPKNWKIYKNEELGVSVRIPDNFVVETDDSGSISILPEAGSSAGGWLIPTAQEMSIDEWWAKQKRLRAAEYTESVVFIKGQRVIRAETREGFGEVHYIVAIEGQVLQILIIGEASLEKTIIDGIIFK